MNYYVDAIYEQGMLKPLEPLALPDHARVKLRIESDDSAAVSNGGTEVNYPASSAPTLLERLQRVVGAVDDLPADSSSQLDHYLYGTPKR